MTWFKVDDKFWSHPKVMFTGLAARGMWASAGAYCADHLTDGLIEARVLYAIVPGSKRSVDALAAELVTNGLWESVPGGWLFHQWCEHQPSKEEVEADRAASRERQRRNRARKRAAAMQSDEPAPAEDPPQDGATVTPLSRVTHAVTNA